MSRTRDDDEASGVLELIRQRLGGMTPSERRVARALLAGPLTIGLESSARLARRAGVSGPTVSRFAGHLGFETYAAFQEALREDVAARVMSPVEVYREHLRRDRDDVLGAAGAGLGEAVETTLAGLAEEDFTQAVRHLTDTRRQVMVAGGWFSHLLAGYLAAVLREFRPRVRHVQPVASERATAVADVVKNDVVAIFDFRRYERDTLELAEATHARGARIILFTDPWLSPVADIADAVLPAQVTGLAPFETLTPTLGVVETLLTAVADELGEAAHRRLARFDDIADVWVRPFRGGAPSAPRRSASPDR